MPTVVRSTHADRRAEHACRTRGAHQRAHDSSFSSTIGAMAWTPSFDAALDPRLDHWRNQMGRLTRNGQVVGHVLLLTNMASTQLGGYLWWRRWSTPAEEVAPRVELIDGTSDELDADEVDIERAPTLWSTNQFSLFDEVLEVTWLPTAEALSAAPPVFGLEGCLDNDDRLLWTHSSAPRH